jgi:hypothetical protein
MNMRAIAAVVLLVAGHRNLFQYVEPPPKKVVVVKEVAKPVIVVPPVVIEKKVVILEIPKPPTFPYRFIGRFGPDSNPFAVFDGGGTIVNVRAGDVIDGKFVVRAIGIESVTIGFEGFPDAEQRVAMGAER